MTRGFGIGYGDASKPRKGRWTMAEVAYLRENYGRRQIDAIARELGRPVASVNKMAAQIFRGPKRAGTWHGEEIDLLRECLGVSSNEVIARVLRRSVADVRRRIATLKTNARKGRWTPEEVARLKRLYGSRRDEDLARIFGRTVDSIRRQAKKLHVAKDKTFLRRLHRKPTTRMPRWTAEDVKTLVRLYEDLPNLEIARRLGRSVKSVVSKAHELSLKKSSERLEAMGRSNVALRADRRS